MKNENIKLDVTHEELQVLAGALICYTRKEDLPDELSGVAKGIRDKVKRALKQMMI